MLSKIKLIILMTLLVVTLAATSVFASPRYGTRAYSMGGAFTAVADDASAIYWNPAGLAESGLIGLELSGGIELRDTSFFSDASDILDQDAGADQAKALLDNLSDNEVKLNLMGVASLSSFGAGVLVDNHFEYKNEGFNSYQDFEDAIDNISGAEDPEKELANLKDKLGDTNLNNRLDVQGIASWGTTFMQPPLNLGSMAFGVNLKGVRGRYDRVELGIDDDDFDPDNPKADDISATTNIDKYEATGYGVDVGALFKTTSLLNMGLSIKNLTSSLEWDDELGFEDGLPRTVTVGAAANLPFPVGAIVAADIEHDEDWNRTYRYGAEKRFFLGLISLRGGMYDPHDEEQVYTGGFGLNLPFVNANFAMDSESYYTMSLRGSF